MRATLIHTADNHLGYEQYGIKERFNDFARAFLAVIDDAIARHADGFLIAGDLFNKRAIDAQTLMQAKSGLERLKTAGIPAVAIEGNHDRTYYRDGVSWLQFLSWEHLLILLNPVIKDGIVALTPWDSQTLQGTYTDLKEGHLRIYGLPWYGAGTARVIEGFARE
jgi:DNA repair exonuclease SbcCD nuclease subunit